MKKGVKKRKQLSQKTSCEILIKENAMFVVSGPCKMVPNHAEEAGLKKNVSRG